MATSSTCLAANNLYTCNTNASLSKDIYGRPLYPSSVSPSLTKVSKVVSVKSSLDRRQQEGKRGFLKVLFGNVGLGASVLVGTGNAYADKQGVSSSRMSYSRFLEYLDKDRVINVESYKNGAIAIVEAVSPELGNRLQRSSGGMGGPRGPGFPLSFGQSKAKFQIEPNTGVTLDDVAGVDEAKQDFMEVVEFLKKPERFTVVGARIPKVVLLIGPPGKGKTLLIKAIVGEAGVPFFSISGSEFVKMFVGVGA